MALPAPPGLCDAPSAEASVRSSIGIMRRRNGLIAWSVMAMLLF
jgi:hypothetical protein